MVALGCNALCKSLQKRRNALKTAIIILKIKKILKSKINRLKKLSAGAPLFYDFLQFKGLSNIFLNISFNPLMVLFHILRYVLDHKLMLDKEILISLEMKASQLFCRS